MSKNPQPARILVVEDEAHLAEGLLFNLQAEGFDVELAYDGESALARLLPHAEAGAERTIAASVKDAAVESSGRSGVRAALYSAGPAVRLAEEEGKSEQEFDAVLLDVMLPGKSGFDVVSDLRAAGIYVQC